MFDFCGFVFVLAIVFAFGVFAGAYWISFGTKSYEQGRFDARVELEEQIRRSLTCSAAAQRREGIVFDAWRDAREMALAMANLAGKSKDQFEQLCSKGTADGEAVLKIVADFKSIEPEYEAWIATLGKIQKKIDAANAQITPPPKAF